MLTLTELMNRSAPALLFECLAGSRAYGTATAASDEDIRGIFAVPAVREARLSFEEIMGIAQDILADCERLKQQVSLPEVCDPRQASDLLGTMTRSWQERQP